MKIVVPVKQVAILDDDFELLDEPPRVDPDSIDWELNEWDDFSLEAALRIREAAGEGEIVVVTVGEEEAEEGLLACLAKGADRGLRIWDQYLENADSLGVARVLASAITPEEPDLVLCGVQSSDAACGATGVALAELLGLPRVAVAAGIELDALSNSIKVERELEGGVLETVGVPMPALITIQTGIFEPRYANMRAIKLAKEKPLTVSSSEDLGLDQSAVALSQGSRIRRLVEPDSTGRAEMIGGSATDVAERIADIVKERLGR